MIQHHAIAAAAAFGLGASAAFGNVQLIAQERTASARTSFNNNQVLLAAPDFQPFAATVTTSVPFPAVGGGTAINSATTTINCLANPNKMRVTGAVSGTAGTAQVGQTPLPVFAEARTVFNITFDVATATPYHLAAAPRPSTDPADSFEVELKNVNTSDDHFMIDETAPPQFVDVRGVLPPGRYQVKYKVEFTTRIDLATAPYAFTMTLGPACNLADVAGLGGTPNGDGTLTADDVIAFLAAYFLSDLNVADVAALGGSPFGDGQLTADDIIAFLSAFFQGCA